MAASVRLFFVAMLLMFWAVTTVYHRNSTSNEVRAGQAAQGRKVWGQFEEKRFKPDFHQNEASALEREYEFSLPFQGTSEAEYCLVVGCLNGDLLGNEFVLEAEEVSRKADRSEIHPPSKQDWTELLVSQNPPKSEKSLAGTGPVPNDIEFSAPSAPLRRSFYMYGGQLSSGHNGAYEEFQATSLAESEHLVIWCDEADQLEIDQYELDRKVGTLIQTFEQLIVPEVIPWLGKADDIDRDEKFAVVLTSRLNQLQSSDSRLEGLTWGGDYHPTLSAPFSNKADLIYLNPTNPDLASLPAIMVHEYVHAISFSKRARNAGGQLRRKIVYEEDWLNEAISHVVETEISGSYANIEQRLQEYNEWPERSPLVISDYYRAGLWRNAGCRGAVFSFVKWCVQQEGVGLIPKLIDSQKTGIQNLESATGKSFESLFRDWGLSGVNKKSRRQEVSAGEQYRWNQASTSLKYIHLTAEKAGRVRYRIVAQPGVRFQASLVRLEDLKLTPLGDFGVLPE